MLGLAVALVLEQAQVLEQVSVQGLAMIRNQNGGQTRSSCHCTPISSSNANRSGPSSKSTHCNQISQRKHCNKLHVSSLDRCRHLKGHHPNSSTRVCCHRSLPPVGWMH